MPGAVPANSSDVWPLILGAIFGTWALMLWFIYWLVAKVERGCPSCAHCQQRIKDREREEKERQDEYSRRHGIPTEPDYDPTRERLFGRQVVRGEAEEVAPPEEGASGSSDGDEGRPG